MGAKIIPKDNESRDKKLDPFISYQNMVASQMFLDSALPVFDALGKLLDDYELTDTIAQAHGQLSMEINDAKKVITTYFLFPESNFINKYPK